MPNRGLFFLFLLGGALVPYLLSSSSGFRETLTSPLNWISKKPEPQGPAVASAQSGLGEATAGAAEPSAVGADQPRTPTEATIPLEQALRWEVSPVWVMSTWPRVGTHLAELELEGYRIPYVSGTTQTDIAGSLTYYFDGVQRLRRITFTGTTGDARRLVQFLMATHQFERRLTDDPATYVYQVEKDGQALCDLKIKTAAVVRAESAHSRFAVSLTMNRE